MEYFQGFNPMGTPSNDMAQLMFDGINSIPVRDWKLYIPGFDEAEPSALDLPLKSSGSVTFDNFVVWKRSIIDGLLKDCIKVPKVSIGKMNIDFEDSGLTIAGKVHSIAKEQYRFPHSKKSRIRKKWSKRDANFRWSGWVSFVDGYPQQVRIYQA